MIEQKSWLAPGKPLPALILLIGIIVAPLSIPSVLSRAEFHYLGDVGIRTYPNLASGLLMSIPGVLLLVFGFLLFYGKINLCTIGFVSGYPILLVIFACLGLVPLIVYLQFYLLASVPFWLIVPLWLASPLGFFCISHIINGLVGLYISKRDLKVNYSKLGWSFFRSIAALGTFCVAFAILFLYWTIAGSEMLNLLPSTSLTGAFLFFCLLGGPVFVTAGMLGVRRQYFKNKQNLFAVLALLTIIVIPLCIFALFCYAWMGVLSPAF